MATTFEAWIEHTDLDMELLHEWRSYGIAKTKGQLQNKHDNRDQTSTPKLSFASWFWGAPT